jgi:hypothetical protein
MLAKHLRDAYILRHEKRGGRSKRGMSEKAGLFLVNELSQLLYGLHISAQNHSSTHKDGNQYNEYCEQHNQSDQ